MCIRDSLYSQTAEITYLNIDGTSGTIDVTFNEEFDFACCRGGGVPVPNDEDEGQVTYNEETSGCNQSPGEGHFDQEERFEHAYTLMLNSAINGIPANGDLSEYTADVSQHINAPSGVPNTPFQWSSFFTSYCESMCEPHTFNFSTAKMVLDANQRFNFDEGPGTILLYFDNSPEDDTFGNSVFFLRTGIEDFSNVTDIVKFDIVGGVSVDLVYQLPNGNYIELIGLPFELSLIHI